MGRDCRFLLNWLVEMVVTVWGERRTVDGLEVVECCCGGHFGVDGTVLGGLREWQGPSGWNDGMGLWDTIRDQSEWMTRWKSTKESTRRRRAQHGRTEAGVIKSSVERGGVSIAPRPKTSYSIIHLLGQL